MLTDFRKAPTVIPDLFIDGVEVERVAEYKYLGTALGNKLNYNKNSDFIQKRCQPRIFGLQKLRFVNVSAAVLRTFYRSCLVVPMLVWWLECESKSVLNKVINVYGKVVGGRLE